MGVRHVPGKRPPRGHKHDGKPLGGDGAAFGAAPRSVTRGICCGTVSRPCYMRKCKPRRPMKTVRNVPIAASQLLLELFDGNEKLLARYLLSHTHFVSPERILA